MIKSITPEMAAYLILFGICLAITFTLLGFLIPPVLLRIKKALGNRGGVKDRLDEAERQIKFLEKDIITLSDEVMKLRKKEW